jgi:guanylate kinase
VNPFPLIISSPSGGGKTTITRLLLQRRRDVGYSISCTTRRPRDGEVHGRDYFFLSREEFTSRREHGEFAESADVHGNLYGTLRSQVQEVLGTGRHVVMDIDVQGARQFATAYPDSVLVFLLPPSAETLLARLASRRSESAEGFLRRVQEARRELSAVDFYRYVVVNDDLEQTCTIVSGIVDSEAVSHGRLTELDTRVRRLLADLEQEIHNLTQNA